MYRNKTMISTQTSSSNKKSSSNAQDGPSNNMFSLNHSANQYNNANNSTIKCPNFRSKSNLTGNGNSNNDFRSNITLERNGSMPHLNASGSRTQEVNATTKLGFAYDKYLSSLEAKYVFKITERKINLNVSEQKHVFRKEFVMLKKQLGSLCNKLKSINTFKTKADILDKKCEVIEILYKNVVNEPDEAIVSLFMNTAFKVIVKNCKKMDETDLNTVNTLFNEIVEPLILLDYENKINIRHQLIALLIKVVMLTNELGKYNVKCKELYDLQESMQNYNSAFKILKAQFGENPGITLLANNGDNIKDIQQVLDEI